MTEYYEEGGLLYEHIKVESPEGGALGGGASEDGFPREDDDSDGSCDHTAALPGGLPFNVVVVHPSLMAPSGGAPEDLLALEHNRAMSSALSSGGAGKRKSRFSGAELEVLVSEVTRCEGELFGPAGRLRRRERERIWAGILERVNGVSRVPRTLREVKKRWDDLKRRNGGRLADARHRTCYLPPGCPRGSQLGRSSQANLRLHQQASRHRPGARGKAGFTGFTTEADTAVGGGGGGDGSEKDVLEKESDSGEREEAAGTEPGGECGDGGDSSMEEEKLGLGGLGALGLGAPPASERWLPPSPLYSAPFLNGTPQPSPQPSLGGGPPPGGGLGGEVGAGLRGGGAWLEEELRGLGEAARGLGARVEQSLREVGEGFRRDVRTLVSSHEALAACLQHNNLLLQRLLGVLEAQQQPQQQPQPQPAHHIQQLQPQHHMQQLQPQPQQPQHHTQQLQPQQPQHHTQQLQPSQPPSQPQIPPHSHLQQQIQTSQLSPQPQQQQQQQQQVLQRPPQPSLPPTGGPPPPPSSVPPPPPDILDGTSHPDPPSALNGTVQRPRRGRTDHRRRRRR